jgi:asparagine synthase (glutamine-hydrolysing)
VSIQFGKCNFDSKAVDPKDLDQVRPVLAPYGPDGEGTICNGNVGILYRKFCTTEESRYEVQPRVSAAGALITWDGRLDNREELCRRLGINLWPESTDVEIVAAAYEQWDRGCFAMLLGDWALSIWDPRDQTVTLAKDFLGTRQLYYSIENDQLAWCTILDPLLRFACRSFALDGEYVAGWLSFFPATHLTPYVGIHAVPPACFVRVGKNLRQVTKYWDFDPGKRTRYPADLEYEEHFRQVFAESVRRRLRSDNPVLAELSGGMDSCSIVCMADDLMGRGLAQAPRLDTLSYYDDSEPNWNERPYFTRVEEKRRRRGWHIDLSVERPGSLVPGNACFVTTPSAVISPGRIHDEFRQCLFSQGDRVVLSGIGGDEVMGGVPTPTPELADLVSSGCLKLLAARLKLWALAQRRPWLRLLAETLRDFLPVGLVGVPEMRRPPLWLDAEFVRQHGAALRGYETRRKLFGALPSFQDNLATVDALRRQICCDGLSAEPLYDRRYPYLDRSLLEFMFSIPREQLVRPGHRRSLMRRALQGIVPDEILHRRRKAYVARAPMIALGLEAADLIRESSKMAITGFGILDPGRFSRVLQEARDGRRVPMVTLLRTLNLETWLRAALQRGLIRMPPDLDGLPWRAGGRGAVPSRPLAERAAI